MELNTQKYLRAGKSPQDLESALGIAVKRHPKYPNLVQFKYDQIESPKDDPIVQECRGLILDEANNWDVVAYPFKRFFNYGEPQCAEIDWSKAQVMEKCDGCLSPTTRVNLWEGGSIEIGKIVNGDGFPVLVGMDKSGNIVPSYIVNKKNNGKKTKWVEIKVIANSSRPKSISHIRLTSSHKVWVVDKYVSAIDLKKGDILSGFKKDISSSVNKMIKASLLGDGAITSNGTGFKFQESHCKDQKQLCNYVEKWLGNCKIKSRDVVSGYGSEMTQVTSKVYDALKILRHEWYPRKKAVPQDLSWFDDFVVAKWYMDDGSLSHSPHQKDRACFATNGFSRRGVYRLAEKLRLMYGVDVKVYYSKGWAIRINAGRDNAIDAFWKAIAPHVISDLRYKLPEKFRKVDYIEYPEGKEIISKSYGEVLSVKTIEYNACGLDLETTTGNFMAQGVLVHNSLISLYNYDNKWNVATSGSPDAGGPVGDFGFTFAELFWKVAKEVGLNTNKLCEEFTYMFELCTPYNQVVVRHNTNKIYSLGIRSKSTLVEHYYKPEGSLRVKSFELSSVNDCIEAAKHLNPLQQEGYVVFDGVNRCKIKSPAYIALHHAKDTCSRKNLAEIIRSGEYGEFETALGSFPELRKDFDMLLERYNYVVNKCNEDYGSIKDIEVQKEFALQAKTKEFPGILFEMRKTGCKPQVALLKMTGNGYLQLMGVK